MKSQLLFYLLLAILAYAADNDISRAGTGGQWSLFFGIPLRTNLTDYIRKYITHTITLAPDKNMKWSQGKCEPWCKNRKDVRAAWAGDYCGQTRRRTSPRKCLSYCLKCEGWCRNGTRDDPTAIGRWGSLGNCMNHCLEVRPRTELLPKKYFC